MQSARNAALRSFPPRPAQFDADLLLSPSPFCSESTTWLDSKRSREICALRIQCSGDQGGTPFDKLRTFPIERFQQHSTYGRRVGDEAVHLGQFGVCEAAPPVWRWSARRATQQGLDLADCEPQPL